MRSVVPRTLQQARITFFSSLRGITSEADNVALRRLALVKQQLGKSDFGAAKQTLLSVLTDTQTQTSYRQQAYDSLFKFGVRGGIYRGDEYDRALKEFREQHPINSSHPAPTPHCT